MLIPRSTIYRVLTSITTTLAMMCSLTPSTVSAQTGKNSYDIGIPGYIFLNGIFYKNGQEGYTVTRAPQGAVVEILPTAAEEVSRDTTTYFTYAGVYYKKTDVGYVVIPQPIRQGDLSVSIGTQLKVNVDLLNVRSGPSLEHAIVLQIHQNKVFNVKAVNGEWCLIWIDDTTEGWVHSAHTSHLSHSAEG